MAGVIQVQPLKTGGGDPSAEVPVSSPSPPGLSPASAPLPGIPQDPPHSFEEPAQKESVFVRLSNRIKNLERNQSLSSGYLEELSRRFKKQNEDLNNSHETFRKTLNESLTKCRRVEENLRYEVRKLNRNLENLRELIWRVEMQRGGLVLFSVLQFLFTVFCWWTRDRRVVEGVRGTLKTDQSKDQEPQDHDHLLLQRKRTNSETLKKVKKKKKRKDAHANALALALSNKDKVRAGSPSHTNSSNPRPSTDFEFIPPQILNSNCSSSNTNPIPQSSSSNCTKNSPSSPVKTGTSFSDVSDLSVSEDSTMGQGIPGSLKKKSKFRSLFFGGSRQ
jgi:hypothetical protein